MINQKTTIILVILLSSIYFVSQFYRASLGTLTNNLEQDFLLNPEELGRLGGLFFLAFSFTQIPLGILLDYYNPLKVIVLMLIIIYFGTLIIYISDSYILLALGRILQGIGCGVCLMGPLVFLGKNFSDKQFPKYSGYIMSLGGLGALVATRPFFYLTTQVGWQKSYLITSFFIIILVSTALFFIPIITVKDKIKVKRKFNVKEYIDIILSKNFLYMLPMSFFGYAAFAFLLTLWGGEFLKLFQKMNEVNISIALMIMAFSWTMGSLFYGLLVSKINSKKKIVIISTLILILLILSLSFLYDVSYYIICFIFGCIGFVGSYTLVVISQYRSLFPSDIIGKVLTTANFFNFLGVFFIHWFTGIIIYLSKNYNYFNEKTGFSISFIFVALYLSLSIYFYTKIDECKK